MGFFKPTPPPLAARKENVKEKSKTKNKKILPRNPFIEKNKIKNLFSILEVHRRCCRLSGGTIVSDYFPPKDQFSAKNDASNPPLTTSA